MTITSPDDPALDDLCEQLAERASATDAAGTWPAEQLRLCGEAGVFRWFLPPEWGGLGWREEQVVRGYLALSQACLTTTFIITQRTGACRRIVASDNESLKAHLLPDLASGDAFATVGISHLTTSGRHLTKPRLSATRIDDAWRLSGAAPWVTGAPSADTVVIGATVVDPHAESDAERRTPDELLVALPMSLVGVTTPEPFQLVGVTASATGPVQLENVTVGVNQVLAGPVQHVMSGGSGGRTGGYETSTLALGLSTAAIDYIGGEAAKRSDLVNAHSQLAADADRLRVDLLATASGDESCSNEALRTRANSLVLRSTQAALAAAKGAGYLAGHPVGRWCREALFFMVWSCPQPVMEANLCELAGIE